MNIEKCLVAVQYSLKEQLATDIMKDREEEIQSSIILFIQIIIEKILQKKYRWRDKIVVIGFR